MSSKLFNIKTLLVIVLIFSLFLRLYKGVELFFWQVDQDLISLTVKRILVDHRPQLIGFPIPGGIYLGPIFYYLASFVYWLSAMDPAKIYVLTALLGTISTYLVWRIGREILESGQVAIFAAIIYGFSYLANVYSRNLSGLTFAPILALLVYLLLYRSIRAKKVVSLFPLIGILLVASQNEGSSLSLVLLTIVIFIIYKVRVRFGQVFAAVSAFLLFHIPLVIFDIRHDFFLTKSLSNFVMRLGGENQINPLGVLDVLVAFPNFFSRVLLASGDNDVAEQILPCADLVFQRLQSTSAVSFILAIIIIGFFLFSQIYKKKSNLGGKIILVHMLLMLIGLFIYNLFLPGYVHEWVLVIFLPAVCLMIAKLLFEIYKLGKLGQLTILTFFAVFIISNILMTVTSTGRYGLASKITAAQVALESVGDEPFYLVSLGSCFAQGYIYLFDYLGRVPSYVEGLVFDPAFFRQLSKPALGVILANPSKYEGEDYWRKYWEYKSRSVSSQKVGEIEVLIVENK